MTHRHWSQVLSVWLLAISATAALPARAQDFPTRPVKIITDSGPGSAVDVILQVIAS